MDRSKLNLSGESKGLVRGSRGNVSKPVRKKKLGFSTFLKVIVLCMVCVLLSVLKVTGVLNNITPVEEPISYTTEWGKRFGEGVAMGNKELFVGNVKKYFKDVYGLNVSIKDVEYTPTKEGGELLAKVKVLDSDATYNFSYVKEDNVSKIREDYGSRVTGELLSKKLTELFKKVLPKNSDIWVVTDSMVWDDSINFSDLSNEIDKWDIGDIVSYNKSKHLIKEININILSGGESNMRKYSKKLLDIATTLSSGVEGEPVLNVGFFKGKNSRNYVYEYIESKYGVSKEEVDFSINWCGEIPNIKSIKNYMYGAIHIDSSASEVLKAYIEEGTDSYIDSKGRVKNIYSKVTDLLK